MDSGRVWGRVSSCRGCPGGQLILQGASLSNSYASSARPKHEVLQTLS
jgi:hypothetical protein